MVGGGRDDQPIARRWRIDAVRPGRRIAIPIARATKSRVQMRYGVAFETARGRSRNLQRLARWEAMALMRSSPPWGSAADLALRTRCEEFDSSKSCVGAVSERRPRWPPRRVGASARARYASSVHAAVGSGLAAIVFTGPSRPTRCRGGQETLFDLNAVVTGGRTVWCRSSLAATTCSGMLTSAFGPDKNGDQAPHCTPTRLRFRGDADGRPIDRMHREAVSRRGT